MLNNMLDELTDLLNQHLNGLRGSINELVYKCDLFNIFIKNYKAGFSIYSAKFIEALSYKLSSSFNNKGEINELLQNFSSMWDEWKYSLDTINYKFMEELS